MRYALVLLLLMGGPASAEEEEVFTPADALYAPEEVTPTAGAALAASGASYYSQARLVAYDFTRPERLLEGAELFIDGQFVGRSPLALNGFLVNKPAVALSARQPGYSEALRPAMNLPVEGEARIAMLSDSAASWYTTPAFAAGLLALGGSVVVYSQGIAESGSLGAGLVIGGVAVIAIAQGIAHFFHLPALGHDVEKANSVPGALQP